MWPFPAPILREGRPSSQVALPEATVVSSEESARVPVYWAQSGFSWPVLLCLGWVGQAQWWEDLQGAGDSF